MKLIPLMCIVFVMILTSFPATINSDCLQTIKACVRDVQNKTPITNRWKDKCCNVWNGTITPELLACVCRVRKNPFENSLFNRVLRPCHLGNGRFKC
ncbi:hypothetical protein N665_2018s0002 [Sinapis alba]|nr:hypothetical protein N665_2018s0002 [Sinapis alba]